MIVIILRFDSQSHINNPKSIIYLCSNPFYLCDNHGIYECFLCQAGPGAQVNKSAILSHLNLNVKAREELEKRKQAAKAAEAAEASASSHGEVSPRRGHKGGEDNTPAIPITSYSSFGREDDSDEQAEDSDENGGAKRINFDLKKRKLGVIRNSESDTKKSKSGSRDVEEESDHEAAYFNVFSARAEQARPKATNAARLTSKQLAALKTNVKKQPAVKQPILKQTAVKQVRDA